MSFRALSIWSLCLTCVVSSAPLLGFADPENKSGKPVESAPGDTSAKTPAGKTGAAARSKNVAEKSPKSHLKSGLKAPVKNQEITAEREQAALDFVAQHHPKLGKLILPLKTSNPKEYQRALKELFRTSERLAVIRLKDPDRYELELEAWKLQSHVRLLAARMTMEDDPEIEQELRGMLKKKAENQLKLWKNEQESLQSRLAQIQQQIERNSKSQEEFVQQEYDRLLKRTEREKQAFVPNPNPGKPVGNKKGNNVKPSATVGIEK